MLRLIKKIPASFRDRRELSFQVNKMPLTDRLVLAVRG